MAKLSQRIDLSSPKEGDLYFLGISSATGVAVLTTQLNRFLDLELSFYIHLIAKNNQTAFDNLPIFTSFNPKENKVDTSSEFDFLDLRIHNERISTKYLLIQSRGDRANLFPRITQLDYLLISNYSLENLKKTIDTVPEVGISFGLNKEHIGNRYPYFHRLFF